MTGTVKSFYSEKGFGFITPDGDDDSDTRPVFVHYTAIAANAGYKTLDQDDRVEFDCVQGQKGPQAENVRKI